MGEKIRKERKKETDEGRKGRREKKRMMEFLLKKLISSICSTCFLKQDYTSTKLAECLLLTKRCFCIYVLFIPKKDQ